MKKSFLIILLFKLSFSFAQNASLKSVLLQQLKTTHNQKEWFVPANVAIEGLTPEQAMWKDKSGNHSVAQLTHHLIFWNEQQVAKFKGLKPAAFSGNNEETFVPLDQESWADAIKRLDRVMLDLEIPPVEQEAVDNLPGGMVGGVEVPPGVGEIRRPIQAVAKRGLVDPRLLRGPHFRCLRAYLFGAAKRQRRYQRGCENRKCILFHINVEEAFKVRRR